MRQVRLSTLALAILLLPATSTLAPAQQQPFTKTALTPVNSQSTTPSFTQFDISVSIVTTTAEEDPFKSLFARDATSTTISSAILAEIASTASQPDDLRAEIQLTGHATPGRQVSLPSGPPASTPSRVRAGGKNYTIGERRFQLRIEEANADGQTYYLANLDLRGPLGGLRSSFSLKPEESAVFALPGNIMATTPPAANEQSRRVAYAIIRIVKSQQPVPDQIAGRARIPEFQTGQSQPQTLAYLYD